MKQISSLNYQQDYEKLNRTNLQNIQNEILKIKQNQLNINYYLKLIVIIVIVLLCLIMILIFFFETGFYQNLMIQKPFVPYQLSKYKQYLGYWYGDQIDFTKIPKRSKNDIDTDLTYDNIDKAASFFNLLGKNITKNQTLQKIAEMQIQYYDKKYQITKFQEQIQICVIIVSYNNQFRNRYKANLDSLFQQNYENYFAIYINDFSTDHTGELVQRYMDKNPIARDKMILINNTFNKGKSWNQYEYGHKYCKSGSIMFPFDGDDNLIGRQVFKLLNAIYQKRKASFVYLNFLSFVKTKPQQYMLLTGFSRNLQKLKKSRDYRKDWIPLHLRCWISDLFLSIPQSDYKFHGQFVKTGQDMVFMFYLQQLAGDGFYYIPEIVYNYNQDTGNNDGISQEKVKQRLRISYQTREKPAYQIYSKQINLRLKKPQNSFQ